MDNNKKRSLEEIRTSRAYVSTRLLDTPFWGIFNLLPFILYKSLHATPFQLAVAVTLKPVVSILSSYFATSVYRSSDSLSSSIIKARWVAFCPFILFPFVQNVWYVIACFGLFMFLQVGMMPAWMELLRQNVPQEKRDKVFSYTQAFGYFGGGLLPFVLGFVLDEWDNAWRWTFFVAAIIALISSFWQRLIIESKFIKENEGLSSGNPLFEPWKNAWNLLKERPDFAKFQMGFMLIGSSLMVIQPALPVFFVDHLNLSYTAMGVAITLCKGIGFATGSPIWVRFLQKIDLFGFLACVALLAVCFPLLLLGAKWQISWLYIAYLVYGLMQSGNELSWNMSGPMFAKEKDSSLYSNVNVIASGIRGVFIPSIGAYLLASFGSDAVIIVGSTLSFLAVLRMVTYSDSFKRVFALNS